MSCIHNDEKEAREENEKPTKFEVNKWIEWGDKTIDHLRSVYNTR